LKVVTNGTVAALLAMWALPAFFGGFDLPVAYGWAIPLLFVAADMSYVSLALVRVKAPRAVAGAQRGPASGAR
jgi:hypothetical protein